ncbi:receptor-type tyrosine-protein phosphatase eta [Pristis pectinata]|uniref:receptor-type tyrosine-protein phosphatase eta n=1 Tax=Pristis pectinata TaxID=685728 RepID=UPI00223C9D22|nr:receptor-type tyrosine-protein phosphatase eta [Pristis pectinata]
MASSWWKAPLLLLGSVFLLQGIITSDVVPKPGDIVVMSVTNNSISLSWGWPADVNNSEYNFNVTYISANETHFRTESKNSTTLTNLLPGTNYRVMIVTVKVNDTRSDPVVKNIFTKPNPVNNVIVLNRTTTSVTLSWDQPFDHKPEYTYKVAVNGNLSTNVTENEFITVTQLNPGTRYIFRVFTLTADNTSADPVTVSSTTVPSKPGAINVTALSNSSISLSLGRPVDMEVNQYNFSITYRAANRSDGSLIESSNSTTIQGLQSGTNYTIVVTTIVHGGVKSEAVVRSQFTQPNPVNNVIVLNHTTTSVTLSWDQPFDHKLDYTYKVAVNGNLSTNVTENEFITVTQLNPGTRYTFSVFTLTADNTSSDPVTVSWTTVPSKPGAINVTALSNSSIYLSLGRPVDMEVNQYNFSITYSAANRSDVSLIESSISTTIQGLQSGTNYTIVVTTIVHGGVKSEAVVRSQFTQPNPVNNVTILNHTTTSVTLSWDQPFDHKPEYTYQVTVNGNLSTIVTVNELITVTQLNPGTRYIFSVVTMTADNTSADPVTAYSTTVPSKPGNITVMALSNSSISLSLGRPVDMEVTQYNFSITYRTASSSDVSLNESSDSISIRNLQSGTNYTISVTTIVHGGVKSEAVVLNHFTQPNEVQNVNVMTVGTNFIILNWTKPMDYKEGYQYMILTEGNPAPTDNNENITVEVENATIKGLTSGTNYSFAITTLVADGTRSDSVKTFSYTKPVQIPEANISVSSSGTVDTLFVSWTQPPGNVEMFFIKLQDVRNLDMKVNSTISTSVNFTNLRPGRVYNVTVITHSGPFNVTSGNVQGITVPSVPGTITVTNVSNSSISLNWGAPMDMDNGSYSFEITYNNGSANMSKRVNTNSIILNLTSGTNYTISVATVGPGELMSDIVSTSQFTKPNVVNRLQFVNIGTDSITLNWSQPMGYKNDYSYLVVTKESSKPTIIIQNVTVENESATVTDLTPGINYTFTVTTHVGNVLADSIEESSYTKPVQIPEANISVSSSGTLDTLFVSWTRPPGNVEMFFIKLQDVKNLDMKVDSTISTSVNFTNLRPGRVYNVTVITHSGPFNVTSDNVQGITGPSPPGAIKVLNFNTSSISLNWGAPADMDDGSYSFNITYSDGSTLESIVKQLNFTTISNLISGTEYTISVATIGPGHLASRIEMTKRFTQPNPIQNLQILDFNTDSISLHWARPGEYKEEYRYRVVTKRSPPFTDGNGNKTTANETVTVDGLTSGTNYTFSVITLAKDGTPAEPTVIANYTEPMKIPSGNISLSNENTTNSLRVTWVRPSGGVENFSVEIKDSRNPKEYGNKSIVQPSVTETVFSRLRPGRTYTVTVVTISGPHHIPSDDVNETTFPTPPGNIVVTNVTNSSLHFSWGTPEDMSINEYTFIVSYQIAQASNSKEVSAEDNKSTLHNLISGTNYTITVFTTIVEQLNSSFVTKSVFTKPNPVNNFRVMATTSSSINLTWDDPHDSQPEYRYRLQTAGNTTSNKTVSSKNVHVDHLNSGDHYTFTIFTQAADGTESNSISLSKCTNAAAISSSSLSCEGVDLNAVLILRWTCPSGLNSGFILKATQNSIICKNETSATCTSNQIQQFNLSNVEFFTDYVVSITTLSCGSPSIPTNISCKSGITNPPPPTGNLELPSLEFTHNTVKFNIKQEAFNSTRGPIVAIAVIVTKDQSESAPNGRALETAYSHDVSTYVTQVITFPTPSQNTKAAALAEPISVNIGNNSHSLGYFNQELTPLTSYRFSLAGFTKLQTNEEQKIDANKSFYSIYLYSQKITLNQNPGVIVGAVVGTILGVLVILVPLLLILLWKKRTKSNNKHLTQLPIPNLSAISVDYFEGYFSKQHADSDCGFAEEYEELKTVGILQSTQVSQQPLNKPKNRYNNVLPYDISRVKLSLTSDPSSDYINANFMPGYNSKKEFIAAQGPLMNTMSDFWRMIWEHHVPAIVMLTKCVEQGRAKCEQYWPTERPLIFEDKIVTLTSEVINEDWTIRDFSLVKDKTGEKYNVRQFHFTGWPDHGVPSTTAVLIEFRNLVRHYINQHQMHGPTVVHCSAGVGRTGTFISIDHMIQQIDNNRKVDIWGIVYQLRMNRPLMVQTESQYVFLNQCAMEYIKSSKKNDEDAIYENTPALIYENVSAIRTAQATNGHIL